MLPYKTLVIIDKHAATPIYQQVANRLIVLIQEGRIQPGTLLPSTRALAALLQLHRKTVVAAYDELARQDWIQTIPRKGVLVSPSLPVIKPRSFRPGGQPTGYGVHTGFSFAHQTAQPAAIVPSARHRLVINDGFADVRESPLPLLLRECRRLTTGRAYAQRLMYGGNAGSNHLRESLCTHLADTRGLSIGPEHVLTTRGAQMSLYLAAALLIRPGDKVIVGASNYRYADLCFEKLGATLIRVPVDDQGIDVQAIAALCKTQAIRMLYVVPHHHHPTTVTLSAERRMQLLQLIRDQSLAVIEDDYDYDFHYASGPILPLASGDHGGNVLYIGSFTKSLALSIRIGFLVAPAAFIQEAGRYRRLIDLRGDNLIEEALAALLDNGDVDRHLKKANKIFHERRDTFCDLLEEKMDRILEFRRPDGGMAIWAVFPEDYSIPGLSAKASSLGLLMNDGSSYRFPGPRGNGVRLGFASLGTTEIREAVRILRKAAPAGWS
jgi:GntR family transcriptional regulator / MocR family aminotransferase